MWSYLNWFGRRSQTCRTSVGRSYSFRPTLEHLEKRELLASGLGPPHILPAPTRPGLMSSPTITSPAPTRLGLVSMPLVRSLQVSLATAKQGRASFADGWKVQGHADPRGGGPGAYIGWGTGGAIGFYFGGLPGFGIGSLVGSIVGWSAGHLFGGDGPSDIGPTNLDALRQQKASGGGGTRGEPYRYQSAYDDFTGSWQGYEPSQRTLDMLQDIMHNTSRENMQQVIVWLRQLQDNPNAPVKGNISKNAEGNFRQMARQGTLSSGRFLPNNQYHWAAGNTNPALNHPLFPLRTHPL